MANNNNATVKEVGNFVISYRAPKEVAISWKGVLGCISTQLMTHEKVKGIVTPTGMYCDLPFEGNVYPGIIFRMPLFMSHNYLETLLFNASK